MVLKLLLIPMLMLVPIAIADVIADVLNGSPSPSMTRFLASLAHFSNLISQWIYPYLIVLHHQLASLISAFSQPCSPCQLPPSTRLFHHELAQTLVSVCSMLPRDLLWLCQSDISRSEPHIRIPCQVPMSDSLVWHPVQSLRPAIPTHISHSRLVI